VIEIIIGPGVETVSPPSSGQPNCVASSPSPRAQRQGQHKARRCRALGGEVGEIYPQCLARDGVGGIAGEKMHALDNGVGGDDEVVSGRSQDRGIVGKIERAGIGGEGLKVARDQRVFTGHGSPPTLPSSSPGLTGRPSTRRRR
jgi:hypothetical protein